MLYDSEVESIFVDALIESLSPNTYVSDVYVSDEIKNQEF